MKETKRHHDAFLFYYELGDKRSLAKVGREFKVSEQSTTKWSRAFDWQKRIQEKNKRIAAIQEKKQETDIAKRKVDYSKILTGTIGQYVNRLKGEPHKCPHCKKMFKLPKMNLTPADFKEMVKLDLLLSGEATDISLIKVEKVHKVMNLAVVVIAEYVPVDKMKELKAKLIKMEVLGNE